MKVAIFFGSKSDIDVMKGAANALKDEQKTLEEEVGTFLAEVSGA